MYEILNEMMVVWSVSYIRKGNIQVRVLPNLSLQDSESTLRYFEDQKLSIPISMIINYFG